VVVEDFVFPAADGAGEAAQLWDVAGVGPGVEQLKRLAGALRGGGAI